MDELESIKTKDGKEYKPWATKDDLQDPASVTALASEIAGGKQAIVDAINDMGGTASEDMSLGELADAIRETIVGNNVTAKGMGAENLTYALKLFCNTDSSYRARLTELNDSEIYVINVASIFENYIGLRSLQFSALTTIQGDYAFLGCSSVTEIAMPHLTYIYSKYTFTGLAIQTIDLPSLKEITGSDVFYSCRNLRTINFPNVNIISSINILRDCNVLQNITFGKLTNIHASWVGINLVNLRNLTIGQDTDINLPFNQWYATNVIAEGQSGIDELNNNLYSNLLTKLYDHSNDGQTRTLRLGWLSNVTQENIDYASSKGWTITT